jgi:hypothetical protein
MPIQTQMHGVIPSVIGPEHFSGRCASKGEYEEEKS